MGKSDHGVADRKSNLWPLANVTLDRTTPFNVTAHKSFSVVCREGRQTYQYVVTVHPLEDRRSVSFRRVRGQVAG